MNLPQSLRSLFSSSDEFAAHTFNTKDELIRVERHVYTENGVDRSTFVYCEVVDSEKVHPNKSSHGAPFVIMDVDMMLGYGVSVDAAIWLPACLGCFYVGDLCVVAGVRLCPACAAPKPEDEESAQRIIKRHWLDSEM